jgi:hypothetical protein
MRPDLGDAVSVLVLLALVALLLPKRDWKSIPARLRATVAGRRQYVFAPPAGRGELSQDFIERWLQLVRRELPRALALGLPLHVLAALVEARGATRQRARQQAWTRTGAGLLRQHLAEELTEADLDVQRRERGLPPRASKLRWTPPHRFTMPPMSLRLEWERHLDALRAEGRTTADRHQPAPAAQEAIAPPTQACAEMEIHTLGEIRICSGGVDFAPQLMHQPVAAFTWLYLLTRDVRKPGDRVTRAVLGDLMFPKADSEKQRAGVRGRLSELSRGQPQPVLRRIRSEGEYVRLDLSSCDLDVRRVLELADRIGQTQDLLSAPLLEEVQAELRLSAEEFLPGWEESERRAGCSGSGASDVVAEVRDLVVAAHLRLVGALADTHLARRQPDRAIPYLEQALRRRPERAELARKLANAYEQSGLKRRAAELREEYGLDDGPSTRAPPSTAPIA